MDRPAVDKVDGVPPAIAIDQTNPVRTSRSTVGTMTELNDHLKLSSPAPDSFLTDRPPSPSATTRRPRFSKTCRPAAWKPTHAWR